MKVPTLIRKLLVGPSLLAGPSSLLAGPWSLFAGPWLLLAGPSSLAGPSLFACPSSLAGPSSLAEHDRLEYKSTKLWAKSLLFFFATKDGEITAVLFEGVHGHLLTHR